MMQNKEHTLTASGLWKRYDASDVVRGVSLQIAPGEIVGLLGPNGAGKTTIVGMLYGLVVATRGEVCLDFLEIKRDGKAIRTQIGVVAQESNLDPDFSVFDNLLHFAHHYRLTGEAARERVSQVLAQVRMEQYRNSDVEKLSGGFKRRLVLARALLHRPLFLFLDEPTTGLDPDVRQDFWEMVFSLRREGHGILITTHYMDEAERLCDRVVLLKDGEVLAEGTPSELTERFAGVECAEIEGVPGELFGMSVFQSIKWKRPAGAGYAFGVDADAIHALVAEAEKHNPKKLVRRRSNLEDVFFLISGRTLE